ncbi:conserved hypothetical protein [gamma proteobacterium HdN1]|nr:conserved hypothetical protein [gamma proteobacterium HdN1]
MQSTREPLHVMNQKIYRERILILREEHWRERLLIRPARSYPRSDHYNGEFFHNLERGGRRDSDVLTWLRTRKPSRWPDWVQNDDYALPPRRLSEDLNDWRVSFVNHATVLIQIGPYNLITDPVWSFRVSPFRNLGPKRVRAAGIALEDLPQIDLVLLSHNHYDHLDLPTLRYLEKRDRPHVVTGLGNASLLRANGLARVSELDWWQSTEHEELKVHFTPAKHFSGRSLRDRNRSLWGGLWVESKAGSLFFGGDTGYGRHFKAIHERLGVPRFALLPIGAYEPYWFMGPVHMNPEDAVRAHLDLQAENTLAIHFNTFQLTDEPIDQPVIDLARALEKHQVDPSRFWVLPEGAGKVIPSAGISGSPRQNESLVLRR